MNLTLQSRCTELRDLVAQLTHTLLAAMSEPATLPRALPIVRHIRTIALRGAEGIDDPSYRSWAEAAADNLGQLERAIEAGDPTATWEAFSDRENGLNLLSSACRRAPGW